MPTPALVVIGRTSYLSRTYPSLGRVGHHLLRRTINAHHEALLVFLLDPQGCIGSQPQRDVCRLHRLPYHSNQVVIEGFQVRLVPELRRECLKGLSSVVLPAVEPAVHEPLHPATQRYKQGSDGEGRGHDCEGGLLTSE